MRRSILSLALLAFAFPIRAQQVRPAASAGIYHELAQLNNLVNVLYVAAHPDDENTRLLSWLVNDRHIRTAYLSLTRGDGGQNLLGSEQGPALGLIRTHELMEARKIDGAEQYFTRAIDFGFSKNSDETFHHWNADQLTHDVVRVMRLYRPDVVICRFPPDARAGHGQHAASAILAARAFKQTGNAQQYAGETRLYPAWQPKRLLLNTYRFGANNTTAEDQFKLNTGQYNPELGMGYGELAGISRSIHRSQGAGTPSVPGIQTEYFKLVDGDTLTTSLFDGIDISWNRVGRKDIGDRIRRIMETFNYHQPDASIPALLDLRKEMAGVKDAYWRQQKMAELDRIILHCAGLMVEAYAKQPEAAPGTTLPFTLHLIARSQTPVRLQSVSWPGMNLSLSGEIGGDTLISLDQPVAIPAATPITEPYWLSQPPKDAGHYTIPDDSLLGLPETPSYLNAIVSLQIGNESFALPVPLSYKKLDPVRGDVVEPLRIVPPVTADFTESLLITRPDGSVGTSAHLHAFKDLPDATLRVAGNGQQLSELQHLRLRAGMDTVIPLNLSGRQLDAAGKDDFTMSLEVAADGDTYRKAQHLIQYAHLPTLQYFTTPAAKVLRNNWKVAVKKIGYIEGAGDMTASFLRQAGMTVDVLKESDFTDADHLKQYDAIITGVRAVNTEKRMSYWLPVLLQYVQNGGTLVMQYNNLQDLATTKIGPYPFTLTNSRVTEEDAKVTFIKPEHRLLNSPNKITDADFNGWVQERGLYFPANWDGPYEPLFRMNDTGEQPLEGATLYAPYGKGQYIYTSLSFFRQLPAGNKGAIRLLMNFLSAGK